MSTDSPSFYFFRHGQTALNLEHRIQGQLTRALPPVPDEALDETGARQAVALAEAFQKAGIKLDLIASSDARRALQTARAVAEVTGAPVFETQGLREMFFGADNEGVDVALFRARVFTPPLVFTDAVTGQPYEVPDGATLRRYHKSTEARYDNLAHPGGESKADVRARLIQTLSDITRQNPAAHAIGVSSHGVALRVLLPELGVLDNAACAAATLNAEKQVFENIHFPFAKPRPEPAPPPSWHKGCLFL